jgi:5-methylcytosine-specific restriction endonuclease McrA
MGGWRWAALVKCVVCETGASLRTHVAHAPCTWAALSWIIAGTFDARYEPDAVRHWLKTCYLCGVAPVQDAEHFVPRARGGSDRWSNIYGACSECNMDKRARLITPTAPQRARMREQQAIYRRHYARVTLAAITPELRRWTFEDYWDIDDLTDFADGVPIPAELSALLAGWAEGIENESLDDWLRRNRMT